MTSPSGTYGAQTYESPESRALESINVDSYSKVYDDQGAFMSKLASDTSYMAAYMRKMQRGIDQANENAIQQIQSLIDDFITLLGGQGDTGFDFGDLKYVIEMVGALFGFSSVGGIPVPINIFNAAWNFFSQYIFPADNFKELIDELIDQFIGTMLDFLGEVPILGQAAEQLAVIISGIRDLLDPIAEALDSFFGAFGVNIDDPTSVDDFFGPLDPIFNTLTTALDGINLPDFTPMFHDFAQWTQPFVDIIVDVIDAFSPILDDVVTLAGDIITPVIDLITPVIQALAPILDLITDVVNALNPILAEITNVINAFSSVFNLITGGTSDLSGLASFLGNLWTLLGGAFLTSDGVIFDIPAWAIHFITSILNPTGLLTEASDFISGFESIARAFLPGSTYTGGTITSVSDAIYVVEHAVSAFADEFTSHGNILSDIFGVIQSFGGGLLQSFLGDDTATTTPDSMIDDVVGAAVGVQVNAVTALTPNNPAVVDLAGRIAVLANSAAGNTWYDGMDRSSLGSNWGINAGSIVMVSSDYVQANTTTPTDLVYTATQFATDQQYAQMRVRNTSEGSDVLAIMGNSAGTVSCGVRVENAIGVHDGSMQIVTCTGPAIASMTVKATIDIGRAWANNDVVGIGYDPTTQTYVAYLNDNALIDFPDTTPVVATTGRYLHIFLNTDGGFSGNRGSGVDNVNAYDWT